MEYIDDKLSEFIAITELNEEVCHLKHSPLDDEDHKAINFICQRFGYGHIEDSQIRIPICAECVAALKSKE